MIFVKKQIDKKFRIPRIFSNYELKRFAHYFRGRILNVSAKNDEDKEGGKYRDYFSFADEYFISNYEISENPFEKEFFLDLEQVVPEKLVSSFDVCFCHTVLEHIYEVRKAFSNICALSRDVVITVVPYIQQIHGSSYSDYWRFTPYTMQRMYEENGLKLRYCVANGTDKASIYLFCIGYRDEKWDKIIEEKFQIRIDEKKEASYNNYKNIIGGNVVD